jgi:tRNA(His) 5'-end guanylyltransferase
MSSLENKYLAYLSASSKESREYDDDFRELEHAYCAELLEKERLELMAIFGDSDEWDANEDEIPEDHK